MSLLFCVGEWKTANSVADYADCCDLMKVDCLAAAAVWSRKVWSIAMHEEGSWVHVTEQA